MPSSAILLLAAASLAGCIQATPTKPDCAATGLLERTQPQAYYTIVSLNVERLLYYVSVDILIGINDTQEDEPKDIIVLNADDDLDVDIATFITSGPAIKIVDICHDAGRQLFVFTLARDLMNGTSGYLNLLLGGKVRKEGTKGIYARRPTKEDNSVIRTDFSNHGARLALPCFDDPRYEVPFKLTVVTMADLFATSSSLRSIDRTVQFNLTISTFNESPPMQIARVDFQIRPKQAAVVAVAADW